jgi:hypothetical protein
MRAGRDNAACFIHEQRTRTRSSNVYAQKELDDPLQ